MKEIKASPRYLADPELHLRDTIKFRERMKVRILGEEDAEWRGELEFFLTRIEDKIRELQKKML